MTVLDIDLDAFVTPVSHWHKDSDPRLADADTEVFPVEQVTSLLRKNFHLDGTRPGVACEHHVEALDAIATQLERGTLHLPLTWIHVDAHDDLWGHYSKPANSGNFLYHCIQRKWLEKLVMIFPADVFAFPDYVFSYSPLQIAFEEFAVPLEFGNIPTFKLDQAPDFIFLARSPAYTPPKADVLYDAIRGLFRES